MTENLGVDYPRTMSEEWFVYFPLLHEVYGPTTEEDARDEAGQVGIVMGPFPRPFPARGGGGVEAKTKKTKEAIQHMLRELEMPAKTLTKWELGFLESISEQFEARRSLSDKQFEILERIYAEKTA